MTQEQPKPIHRADLGSVQDAVIEKIQQRKKIGLERYGTLLQPHNGRDAFRDLEEELLDALQYVTQYQLERPFWIALFKPIYTIAAGIPVAWRPDNAQEVTVFTRVSEKQRKLLEESGRFSWTWGWMEEQERLQGWLTREAEGE